MFSNKITIGLFLSVVALAFVFGAYISSASEPLAKEKRVFVVSAYYSPLPNQDTYVWGSYENDIYVNGRGVRGADFTKVYLGMLAAPSSYPFGTKIYIPEFGIGTVHDRGGKIVAGEGGDRIDIWMGWGDDGRKRALEWGMKKVIGEIQPWNTSNKVEISIASYDSQVQNIPEKIVLSNRSATDTFSVSNANADTNTLQYGDYNQSVTNLQNFLKTQGLFSYEPTGYYGEKTQESVYQFQKFHSLVGDENSPGAGIFGPKTRTKLEELWGSANTNAQKIGIKKSIERGGIEIFVPEVNPPPIFSLKSPQDVIYAGIEKEESGDHVASLQKILSQLGFFRANHTGYYGDITEQAVFEFQLKYNIVSTKSDIGAGRFGPKTYAKIMDLI